MLFNLCAEIDNIHSDGSKDLSQMLLGGGKKKKIISVERCISWLQMAALSVSGWSIPSIIIITGTRLATWLEVGSQNLSARDQGSAPPFQPPPSCLQNEARDPGFLLRGAVGSSDKRCGLKACGHCALGTPEQSDVKGGLRLSGYTLRCWSQASWWEETQLISREIALRGDISAGAHLRPPGLDL